jgi:hypothetical protein
MPTINITGWSPGTLPHIKAVLRGKHPGQEVVVLYRVGGEVVYLVSGKM